MNLFEKYKKYILLFLVFLTALVFRFYKLGEVPYGFYQDESAIGYNAYSILRTGKDEYGKTLPVYFKSFGDYKLPVYIYSSIIPVLAFGLNEFSVRFISAFFGLLTVLVIYFLVKEITKETQIALISAFLVSINPWHLHYSRATFEVSLVLFFTTLGTLLLLKSFTSRRKFLFIPGTVFFILSVYTYNLSRLLSPVLYFFLLIIYQKNVKELPRKILTSVFIISLVFLLPFLVTFIDEGGFSSARGTLLGSSGVVQAGIIEFRSYLVSLPFLVNKLLFNNYTLTFFQYLKNIVSYFSVDFYFLTGSGHGNHGIGNTGQFYIFEILTIVSGFIYCLFRKTNYVKIIFGWFFLTVLVASLTRESPHATRSFTLVFPLSFLSALGIFNFLQEIKSKILYRKIMGAVFFLFAIFNISYYFTSYYFVFPQKYAKSWRSADKELSLYLGSFNKKNYPLIVIDQDINYIYTSFLFYNRTDPMVFQSTQRRAGADKEGFDRIISFDNVLYEKTERLGTYSFGGKKLLVTNKDFSYKLLSEIHFPQRPVAFSEKETIYQYPVKELAYKVYEIE